jgi:hypothetical protein
MTTIHQPLHLLDCAVMVGMRKMVVPMKGSVTGPEARKPFDELMEKTPAAPGVTYEVASVGGIAGVWCRPDDAPDAAAAIPYSGKTKSCSTTPRATAIWSRASAGSAR